MQSDNFGSFSNDPSISVALPSSSLVPEPTLGKSLNLSATLSLSSEASYQNLTPIKRQASPLRETLLPFRGPDHLLGTGTGTLYSKSSNQPRVVRTILGTALRDVINTVNRVVAVGDRLQILARGANDSIRVGLRTSAYGEIGNDVLDARYGRGGNYLYGNAGADTLYARSNDFLIGGDGNDVLWAGLGRNRLTGGLGADRFWIGNGRFPAAVNTVADFNPAADLLMIRNLPGVRSFADISLVQRGTGTRVFAAGRAIADIAGVLPNRLRAGNFRILTNDPLVPAPTITAGLATDTGASNTDFITQNATITGQVGGTRLSRFEVKVDNGSFVDLTNQLVSGQFTLTAGTLDTLSGGTLSNGQHTLQFRATNNQNTVTLQDFTFTLDTTAPGTPTFNAPGVTASTNAPYTFTVTYTDNQAIQVGSLGDGDVRVTGPGNFTQTATLVSVDDPADGTTRTATYQITPPGNGWDLAENGTYTIEVLNNEVSDVAGNSLAGIVLGTFGVDIPLNLNVGLTSDTGASNSDRITTTAGITGSIQGNGFSTLQISINNGTFQDVTNAVAGNNFAFTAAQLQALNGGPLQNGANTIVLRATTTQNAVTEQTLNFTLDTAAPTATVSASNVTAVGNTYTFTVTLGDNNAIDVSTLSNGDVRVTGPGGFNQAANLVSIDTNEDGTPRTATFQITPPGGGWDLADNGTYTVALVAGSVSDLAGNTNAAANLGTFTVDFLAAPTVTVGLTNDTGVSNTDRLTNTVGVTGQVTGSSLSQLQVRVNNGDFVDATTALNLNTGAYTLTPAQVIAAAGGTLANGVHTLTIRATNSQGTFTDSNLNFTLNTAPVTATGNAANVSVIGNAYTFTVTFSDDNAVDISSLGDGDVRVTGPNAFNQTATLVSVDVNSNGTPRTATYQITPPSGSWDLADNGTYTVELLASQVSDIAGNVNAVAVLDTFTVNIVPPPTVTVQLANDTGTSNTDRITSAVGISGVTGNSVTQLQVRVDDGSFVDVTGALNTSNGAYTLTSAEVIAAATGGALANGVHTLTIRATNSSGSVDSNLNFTFDNQAPLVRLVNAVNAIAAGGTTYNFTITFNDAQGIDVSTLGNGDVQVTGPNGFTQAATFVSSTSGANGDRTATYQISVPGGSWNFAENGLYTLSIGANQVLDTAGNAIAAGTAGYFSVLVPSRINFQPTTSTASTGYAVDSGLGFDATRGYGWVTEGTSTALDISARVFDRAAAGIESRLDTVALMQSNGTAAATAAAWEYTLANGRYSVTVSMGDSVGGSNHFIRAEGNNFLASPFNTTTTGGVPSYFKLATLTVDVTDGRLTLDAIGGTDTRINYVEIVPINPGDHPSILSSPLENATNVNRRSSINISDLNLIGVGEGVDGTTLTSANIQIYRTRDGAAVASNYNTSGGADTIIIQPINTLDSNTQYTVRISDGVKDLGGRSFLPYSLTFTTGNISTPPTDGVSFTQSIVFGQTTSNDAPISTLLMSPDNQFLYGSTLDGNIYRWAVQPDGSLAGQQIFTMPRGSLTAAPELIGIAFDPTNSNVLWVAQNTATGSSDAVDFSGKIVKLTLTGGTGAFTATAQDYIVGLPRSGRDHFGNSLRFGPDGKLYLTQGSNTSAGVADTAWGMRPERLLTAAMLQIDTSRTAPTGGFNVRTEGLGANNYNPYAQDAVLKVYASGLRNSYDFVFHSNGNLYAPVNGSGGGGITPDDPNTVNVDEGLENVASRADYVYRITEGGYYGHPNPSRGEYIMAGGNPTSGNDPQEVAGTDGVTGYPVGTQPDPDYQPALFTFGISRAPTGVIEYQSNTFNGRLRNRLLVAEYSSGDDILTLDIDPVTGTISSTILAGGSVNPDWGMANPLDIIENTSNGNLYVAELYPQGFGANAVSGRIRLMRPA